MFDCHDLANFTIAKQIQDLISILDAGKQMEEKMNLIDIVELISKWFLSAFLIEMFNWFVNEETTEKVKIDVLTLRCELRS